MPGSPANMLDRCIPLFPCPELFFSFFVRIQPKPKAIVRGVIVHEKSLCHSTETGEKKNQCHFPLSQALHIIVLHTRCREEKTRSKKTTLGVKGSCENRRVEEEGEQEVCPEAKRSQDTPRGRQWCPLPPKTEERRRRFKPSSKRQPWQGESAAH